METDQDHREGRRGRLRRRGRDHPDRDLATGLSTARWNDASPKEQDHVRALDQLSADGQHPTGADVAGALNRPAQALSYLRERFVKKGTICTEGRALRLAVPSMAGILNQQQ